MATGYSYTIYAEDLMSSTMFKIAENTGKAFSKINNTYSQFKKKNNTAGNSIENLRQRLGKFTQKHKTSFSVKEIGRFNNYIQKTQKQLKNLENLPPLSFQQKLKNIGEQIGGLANLTQDLSIALGAFRKTTGILKLGADMEQTRISFTNMLASAKKAGKIISNLQKLGSKAPLSNADLQKNTKHLLNFGITNKKTLPALKMLGKVLGINKEKLNLLSLAYTQIQSAGKLSGENLLQIFKPLQGIFEKTGLSMSKLKKKMSKGKISTKITEDKPVTVKSKNKAFSRKTRKQNKTFSGKLSAPKGKIAKIGISIGKELFPDASKLADVGLMFIDMIPELSGHFNSLKGILSENGGTITALSGKMLFLKAQTLAFTAVTKAKILWTKIATAGQWLWNAAMTANPIGLIIAGIVALGAAVVWAYNKIGWFRGGIKAAWEGIKGFAIAIKDLVIGRIKEIISGLTGIGKTLMLFFKGEWKAAWQEGKKAAKNLTGIGSDSSKKFVDNMKKAGKKAGEAYHEGIKEVDEKKKTKKIIPGTQKIGTKGPLEDLSNLDTANSPLANSTALTGGINSISEGGKKQTNINVQFDKLIEQLNIKSETLTEGIDEMEDKIKEVLMRILNGANQMQTQSM